MEVDLDEASPDDGELDVEALVGLQLEADPTTKDLIERIGALKAATAAAAPVRPC